MTSILFTLDALPIVIDYTNWKGVRSRRLIASPRFLFGSTEFHPEPQLLVAALDLDKQAERTFAFRDIHSWAPAWTASNLPGAQP